MSASVYRAPLSSLGEDASFGPVTAAVTKSEPITAATDPVDWLLGARRQFSDPAEFFGQLCWVLVASGMPLSRASAHFNVLHPQLRGVAYRWWRERACVEELAARHGIEQTPAFRASPLYPVVSKGEPVRYRLEGSVADDGIALLRELREQGVIEYVAFPMTFSSGRHQAVSLRPTAPADLKTPRPIVCPVSCPC